MTALKDPQPIKVTLLDGPRFPLETLWVVWEQSRHNRPLPSPGDLHNLNRLAKGELLIANQSDRIALDLLGFPPTIEGAKSWSEQFYTTVEKLFHEEIPCVENLTYVFQLENVPISLREQLVRHRIGTKVGPRIGADIAPDLAESSFWSQTMRVLDMGNFYADGRYILPEGLKGKVVQTPYGTATAENVYKTALNIIASAYRDLVQAGVHIEDARQLIPIGATHRLTWEINVKAMMHIIGKRSCWISQRGMWEQVIQGMVEELCEQSEFYRNLVNPPCLKRGTFGTCPFTLINEERISGADGFPPCPLWLHHYRGDALKVEAGVRANGSKPTWFQANDPSHTFCEGYGTNQDRAFPGGWISLDSLQATQMGEWRTAFANFWGRDVDTGERHGAKAPTTP